jgi:hypothetical protein
LRVLDGVEKRLSAMLRHIGGAWRRVSFRQSMKLCVPSQFGRISGRKVAASGDLAVLKGVLVLYLAPPETKLP